MEVRKLKNFPERFQVSEINNCSFGMSDRKNFKNITVIKNLVNTNLVDQIVSNYKVIASKIHDSYCKYPYMVDTLFSFLFDGIVSSLNTFFYDLIRQTN